MGFPNVTHMRRAHVSLHLHARASPFFIKFGLRLAIAAFPRFIQNRHNICSVFCIRLLCVVTVVWRTRGLLEYPLPRRERPGRGF
jgi:hypothetical protein